MLKEQPVQKWDVQIWSDGACDPLWDCFESTDCNIFCESHGNGFHSPTHGLDHYINFCVETIVPSKRANPWVTPDPKAVLNGKKRAFFSQETKGHKGTVGT